MSRALRQLGRHGFPYRGELRRTDYAAIYEAFDSYGSGPAWRDEPD